MKVKNLLLLITISAAAITASAQPTWQWVKKVGSNPSGTEQGTDIVSSASGSSYVTGSFENIAMFGSIQQTSAGLTDFFLAKYDKNGNVVWAKHAGDTGNDQGNGIVMDNAGNLYVTGFFNGTVTFGNLPSLSSTFDDIFIVKYDTLGNALWAVKAGGATSDRGNGISADTLGNIYITGYFSGSAATFGSLPSLSSSGSNDAFIAKYDTSGTAVWAKKGGSSAFDVSNAIATMGDGTSFITGQYSGNASFGSQNITNSGGSDIFVVKYNAAGTAQWAKKAGGSSADVGQDIEVDATGRPFVTGYYSGSASFGSNNFTSNGAEDIFIAKYSATGTVAWVNSAGGTGSDMGFGLRVYNDKLNATGQFSATISFGSLVSMISSGGKDIYLTELDTAGAILSAEKAGGSQDDKGAAVTYSDPYTRYLTGSFSTTATFGNQSVTSVGGVDFFIGKISCLPVANFNYTGSVNNFTFSDTSSNNPVSWAWTFQGGTPSTSTQSSQAVTWPADGMYEVCLTVTNSCGTSTYCDSISVFGVGINEAKANANVSVYPNPSNTGSITISSSLSMDVIEVYNMNGQLIHSQKVSASQAAIDLSSQAKGVYQLRLITGEGAINRKIVLY